MVKRTLWYIALFAWIMAFVFWCVKCEYVFVFAYYIPLLFLLLCFFPKDK